MSIVDYFEPVPQPCGFVARSKSTPVEFVAKIYRRKFDCPEIVTNPQFIPELGMAGYNARFWKINRYRIQEIRKDDADVIFLDKNEPCYLINITWRQAPKTPTRKELKQFAYKFFHQLLQHR